MANTNILSKKQKHQDGKLQCPNNCKEVLDPQEVAKVLPKEEWEQFQEAVVDGKVARKEQELKADFDRRLQEKVCNHPHCHCLGHILGCAILGP